MRLNGRTALVTGGASGFGAEIVRRYVQEGAKVVILDLNGEGADKLAKEAGDGTIAFAGDVTKRADIGLKKCSRMCSYEPLGTANSDLAANARKPTPPSAISVSASIRARIKGIS